MGREGSVVVDGKQFAVDGNRFAFHGVTYGTFAPRGDGARYPDRHRVTRDFEAMRDAGFTVVRTYTPPPPDVVDCAAKAGLRLLAGIFWADWRYMLGAPRSEIRRLARQAVSEVASISERLAGDDTILALSLGNEIPTDVLRWVGTDRVAGVIEDLVDVVHQHDPDRLVTYANYPSAEYLPLPSLDFVTFNVFLEERTAFRRYLTRLQHLAGDRPLVLGEIGLAVGRDEGGEQRQADSIDWQLETALERGVAGTCLFSWTDEWQVGEIPVTDWHFGLTRGDRSPRPSLEVAARWNGRKAIDLRANWPSITVGICAYNASATLDECLRHTCALDYPNLEVVVVDDGSTDDTASIAERYERVHLVRIEHAGLSVARNEVVRAATGTLIAYLDSDAYPSPEWPYYLALGMDGAEVVGVGGPNLPPPGDGRKALQVAHAPGGPVHVLLTDDRAEHLPGCNMAFRRAVLEEVGVFVPVYTAAGDDVDLCWRVLDRGHEIAFHPAALVWHHRRTGLRAYLRQQRGYGRAEALVGARHPDRITRLGTSRWRGQIYTAARLVGGPQRIYRGMYGAAAYQSVYMRPSDTWDIAHQIGVPVALGLVATAPLALLTRVLGIPALAALIALLGLISADVIRTQAPRRIGGSRLGFRVGVAWMQVLQPIVRAWGRLRSTSSARRSCPSAMRLPALLPSAGGMLLMAEDRPRAALAAAVIASLRRARIHVPAGTGWEPFDARMVGSSFITGDLLTSSHPPGYIQLRVRRHLRWMQAVVAAGAVAGVFGALGPVPAAIAAAAVFAEIARGLWRTGPFVRDVIDRASRQSAVQLTPAFGRPAARTVLADAQPVESTP